MNLFFRLIYTFVTCAFKSRIHPLAESVKYMRVWPNDLDLNFHVNNGRFLTLMDLGRYDLILRTGLFRVMLKKRWAPLVGAVHVRYKLSLWPFDRFRLRSKVIGWDDKWFYVEQRFEKRNRTIAVALVKTLFRGEKGNIPPQEVLRASKVYLDPPEVPEKVRIALSLYDKLN